ncbi:protein-disulfide reductase DsbD [Halomonas sp. I5-271120]|uniref:protein-disulfide reductase DsbD n=1 Tax=Halomonas sp. I5-271120 TaxID=3061632 RepID=UPI00271557A7|nr:protein-disulfide reductase DsbD [Halomonas sp. I5-271120]
MLALASSWSVATQAQEPLPVDQAFQISVDEAPAGTISVGWQIEGGHYLYADTIHVTAPGGQELEPMSPVPVSVQVGDSFFGTSDTYPEDVTFRFDPAGAEELDIAWQGCAGDLICYSPQSATLDVTTMTLSGEHSSKGAPDASLFSDSGEGATSTGELSPIGPSLKAGEEGRSNATGQSGDQAFSQYLLDSSAAYALLVFFGMGLLLTFTPCVLPMLPIISSIVVGAGGGIKRGAVLSASYVLPMALTYALVGALAAIAGANLQAMLQTPWVLAGFSAIFVALALAMFGLYELQLPAMIRQRLDHISGRQQGGTIPGAAGMGVLSALLVGPCMTAPLAGALLYITETGDVALGGMALLALGLGMGVPVMIVGTLGSAALPKPGAWMDRVKAVFGFVLLGMAVWFLSRVLPDRVILGMTGALLFAAALSLWLLLELRPVFLVGVRTLGVVLGIWGSAMVLGSTIGATYPLRPFEAPVLSTAGATATQPQHSSFLEVASLEELNQELSEAHENGQWTVVDVSAEWCVLCQRIEQEVLPSPAVVAALEGFNLVRADVTETSAQTAALTKAFGIMGPPTLMLINPDGQERRILRLVGKFEAEDVLDILRQVSAG